MSKDLTLFSNFWNDVPSFFSDKKNILSSFEDSEFSKILSAKCDFEELDDAYHVELEVPGVKKNEIDIELKDDRLSISWERRREKKKGFGKSSRYERSEGRFSRTFHVAGADIEKIDANLKHGVLTIELPKLNEYKAKKININ